MAEYKSIHKGKEIDEAVTRSLNLTQEVGYSADKIMSQKAVTEQLNSKMDKIEGKGLSSNDFTDEIKEKLEKLNTVFEFSLSPDNWEFFNDDTYIQTVPQEKLKSTDTAIAEILLSSNKTLCQREMEYWSNVSKIELCDGYIKTYLQGKIPNIVFHIRIKL